MNKNPTTFVGFFISLDELSSIANNSTESGREGFSFLTRMLFYGFGVFAVNDEQEVNDFIEWWF